jgi:hypothetical protein
VNTAGLVVSWVAGSFSRLLRSELVSLIKNWNSPIHMIKYINTRERACSLVVTRVPVAPQSWVWLPVGANLSRFNDVCAFSGSRRSCR